MSDTDDVIDAALDAPSGKPVGGDGGNLELWTEANHHCILCQTPLFTANDATTKSGIHLCSRCA